MSVISYVSPKGGAGKSTSCLIFGLMIAHNGVDVTFIDADPNHTIGDWSKLPGLPAHVTVKEDANEDTIVDTIDDARKQAKFVLVDLEGTASVMVNYAIGRSDLVVIPIQASAPELKQAIRTVRLIRLQEKMTGRSIPFVLLFTRIPATAVTRRYRSIDEQLGELSLPVLDAQLIERDAFKALMADGGDLYSLNPARVPNIKAAIENAEAYASKLVYFLRHKSNPEMPALEAVNA
ncbi:MAG TPA: ParA family protein [Rhizomicrobium sp.]|nr:ParA family protein [Rhizomicrobium sp.]